MNEYDYPNRVTGAMGNESYPAISTVTIGGGGFIANTYVPQSALQSLDMNKIKYEWCYDILCRINEVIQSTNKTEDKLHAIAWFTKQGLK